MCGRFNSIASGKDFAEVYGAEFLGVDLPANHNVAPTALVHVLSQFESRRLVETMTWGLVPSWSKDKTRSASMINARSETLFEKPSFRNLVNKYRCVIPIQGFYEWQVLPRAADCSNSLRSTFVRAFANSRSAIELLGITCK
ncbi:MAG: SOS response-associated peptidase [Actinobacteria bacterium]|nr:SOS response-associated peptidase [Actinomycetota bacterium]